MERYVSLSSVLISYSIILFCYYVQPPVGDIIQMNQALVKDLQDTYLNGALEEKISIDEVKLLFLTRSVILKRLVYFVAGRELK